MLRRYCGKLLKDKAAVPDVFAAVGWENRVTFVSHPGVMAVAKLLEQKGITRMKATFNQELIHEIAEHDEELARKAQIAFDNDLSVEWRTLDFIETELPRLLAEKKEIEGARTQVLHARKGDYTQPKFDSKVVVPTPANLGEVFDTPNKPTGDPSQP
jgi:hypothetical protein